MNDQSCDNLLPLLAENNIQGSHTQISCLLEKNKEANQTVNVYIL